MSNPKSRLHIYIDIRTHLGRLELFGDRFNDGRHSSDVRIGGEDVTKVLDSCTKSLEHANLTVPTR